MREEWRPIEGTNGIYEVSNTGKVRSRNYLGHGETRELSLAKDWKGYRRVRIYTEAGERATKKVHRLVAEAFIANPFGKPEVNHKDGNKENNNVLNLEWCTPGENTEHAYSAGLKENTRARCKLMGIAQIEKLKMYREAQKTPVIATHIETGDSFVYASQAEASAGTGAPQPNINKVLRGLRKSAHGFSFVYGKGGDAK